MSKYILLSLLAYFCGSIPSGVWIGKMVKGIDIRTVGSKNSGATNAYRTLGAKCGIATLILDALKGYLPLYVASHFDISDKYIVVIGLIAIFAHSMSCFLNFKGGKGVATSLGAMLAVHPVAALTCFAVFGVVVAVTKYVSLGSVIGIACSPIVVYLMGKKEAIPVTVFLGLSVIYTHRANLKRVFSGNERKIGQKKN